MSTSLYLANATGFYQASIAIITPIAAFWWGGEKGSSLSEHQHLFTNREYGNKSTVNESSGMYACCQRGLSYLFYRMPVNEIREIQISCEITESRLATISSQSYNAPRKCTSLVYWSIRLQIRGGLFAVRRRDWTIEDQGGRSTVDIYIYIMLVARLWIFSPVPSLGRSLSERLDKQLKKYQFLTMEIAAACIVIWSLPLRWRQIVMNWLHCSPPLIHTILNYKQINC